MKTMRGLNRKISSPCKLLGKKNGRDPKQNKKKETKVEGGNPPPHLADSPFVFLLKFVVSVRHHYSKINKMIKHQSQVLPPRDHNSNNTHRNHKFQDATHSGSIFSIIFRLLNLLLSACLKNLNDMSRSRSKPKNGLKINADLGASSMSHLGSMVMHSCMYLRAFYLIYNKAGFVE